MDVLIIGSGGREHALVYGLRKSPNVGKIYALPGNGGINDDAIAVDIKISDHQQIATFAKDNNIGLVVVGPENPLVDGIVDYLQERDIKTFGPSKKAAQIEGSKEFMKDIADKYNIPTAEYQSFSDAQSAKDYVERKSIPIVIKTDGLAAGKGVIIAQTKAEAFTAIDEMFNGRFGDAGKRIVIEEFLTGEEASFFAICDGENAIAFGSAQDHKAVGEGDTGPNTGGMGTYSPAPVVTDVIHKKIMEEIITPFVDGMNSDGMPYCGVIFAGVMIEGDEVKLLEFNVRFGDPECQVLMARLESDLLPILLASCDNKLGEVNVEFSDNTAICVVMAANGYPADYQKGTEIKNIEHAGKIDGVTIFHAGTKRTDDGKLLANGGRVLGVTAVGENIISAQTAAYQAVDIIDWSEGFCRRDIGWRAIARLS